MGEETLKRSDTLVCKLGQEGPLLVTVLDDRLEDLGSLDEILTPDGLQIGPFLRVESPEAEPLENGLLSSNRVTTSWVIIIFGDMVDWVTRRPWKAASVWVVNSSPPDGQRGVPAAAV